MNIERVAIQRYGPLQVDIPVDGSIKLISGPNESGKTLFVEALLKILLGDDSVSNPRIDETPAGFVVIDDDGTSVKLGTDETLIEYYDRVYNHELTPAEVRNIFVIQDSDLRIPDEDAFYERVTDRITGLRTRDIRRVQAALLDAGRLTETRKNISSKAAYDNAGDQRDRAETLRGDIEDYLDSNTSVRGSDDVSTLERELFETKQRKHTVAATIEELEAARRRARHEDLLEATTAIESATEALSTLPESAVIEDLSRRLSQYEGGSIKELSDQQSRYGSFTTYAMLGGVAIGALLAVMGQLVLATVVPLGGFLAGIFFAIQYRRVSKQIGHIDAERTAIINGAHRIGIEADSVGEVEAAIDRMQADRERLTTRISELNGRLKQQLDTETSDTDDLLEQAWKVIEANDVNLEDGDSTPEYDPDTLARYRAELEDIEAEIESLEAALTDHSDALSEFARRANQLAFRTFTGEPLTIEVTSVTALETLRDRLDRLISSIERDAELARIAHGIFETIETKESRKVAELFGPDQPVSDCFSRITDGRYEVVDYRSSEDELVVKRPDGQTYSVDALSHGTRDQLYLSIRVGLADALPDVGGGFFVMDDAFLAADAQRLQRQVAMLTTLAEDDYQVLYLSAKEDAIEAIEAITSDTTHQLHRL